MAKRLSTKARTPRSKKTTKRVAAKIARKVARVAKGGKKVATKKKRPSGKTTR